MTYLEFDTTGTFSEDKCPHFECKMIGSIGCEDCDHYDHMKEVNKKKSKVACTADENKEVGDNVNT